MKKKSSLFIAATFICFAFITNAQNIPSFVPTSGLVGWWPFNGNANDESGNGNNGTVNGASLTIDRFSNTNKAYSFDGLDDLIDLTNNFNLNTFSLSFWIKSNQNTTGTWPVGYSLIITKEASAPMTNDWAIGLGAGNIKLKKGNSQTVLHESTSTTSVNDNTWKNIVILSDSISVSIYINGTLSGFYNHATINFNNPNYKTILGWYYQASGVFPVNSPKYFFGSLDDIGIWNRKLTVLEIASLYNAPNCSSSLIATPQNNLLQTGSTAIFNASINDPNATIVWQSDFGQGYQNLNNYGNYTGTSTSMLSISNIQLPNHTQKVRAISTSGSCNYTSNIVSIMIIDTCINTINDTNLISVTDTLLINALITSVFPLLNNTIKVFPNPSISHIYIDNGNFQQMNGYSIRIDNTLGQQVFQSSINQQQFYIDLSTWSGNGLYFLYLINPQGQTIDVKKIVLQ